MNLPGAELMLADATRLPFRDQSVDAVVTDFPYGQSVCIRKESTMDKLYDGALAEIRRILVRKQRAVVVTHCDISAIAARHFTFVEQHYQRVHKSLTRHVLVLGDDEPAPLLKNSLCGYPADMYRIICHCKNVLLIALCLFLSLFLIAPALAYSAEATALYNSGNDLTNSGNYTGCHYLLYRRNCP